MNLNDLTEGSREGGIWHLTGWVYPVSLQAHACLGGLVRTQSHATCHMPSNFVIIFRYNEILHCR